MTNRRAFITGLGTAAAWPMVARAQQATMPVVATVHMGATRDTRIDALYRGLGEMGYVYGRNVIVDFRLVNRDAVPGVVADLINNRVAVIFGQAPTALAAKSATTTIPIVFGGSEPISEGLVTSYSRPGGNVTGVRIRAGDEPTKLLELLHELLPKLSRVGMLMYPSPSYEFDGVTAERAARAMNLKIIVERAADESQFNGAFGRWIDAGTEAILVDDSVYFDTRRSKIIALAESQKLPAVSNNREFAVAGGLASYGANIDDVARQCGVYVGRILKGEKPGDLPIAQPTKFDLVINLKTAKALDVNVPPSLLARADEVIE